MPALATSRFNGPSARRYGTWQERALCLRPRQSGPGRFGRPATIRAARRKGNLPKALIDKQNGMAAAEKTDGRPSRGASPAMSLSTRIGSDPRFLSAALQPARRVVP